MRISDWIQTCALPISVSATGCRWVRNQKEDGHMPMPGEPMLSRQAAALILREQYRAYASARRIGDSVVAWKALEWAHNVAQPYMGAHLASPSRMPGYAAAKPLGARPRARSHGSFSFRPASSPAPR